MQRATQLLTHRDLLRVDKNYKAAAAVANLIYVSDKDPGINREKNGKGFSYHLNDRKITEEATLLRIKKLAIPPAWSRVWICQSPNGHIQVTGLDKAGRKQYKYHPRWASLQHETKFHRLYEFGKMLPTLRKKIEKDLSQDRFPESKVLAMVISLMEKTYIRVGNDSYEKRYGSYGLTTLKNKHVDIKGDKITFSFKGKKGVYHRISLKSKRFARIIKQCKSIPGSELFQYIDEQGKPHKIDSGQVNLYIKECAQADFTTKDFRTWAGSLMMLRALLCAPPCEKQSEYEKNIQEALKEVSLKLGNTVAVCKKYYIHPEIVNIYKSGGLLTFSTGNGSNGKTSAYMSEECLLMQILDSIKREKVSLQAIAP